MVNSNNCYVVISSVIIFSLGALLINCKNTREDLCLCHGAKTKVCPDRCELKRLYECGDLTENSDLAGMQKARGLPQWSTRSFGEYDPKPKRDSSITNPASW